MGHFRARLLEGRGEKLYLISMIDDETSQPTARFVRSDSTEESMRLQRCYLEQHGRPVAFYTDKASLFVTTEKRFAGPARPSKSIRCNYRPPRLDAPLRELGITWIAAHSSQAKGRIERSFLNAQDRLVKGLRVAGATTLEQANQYLRQEFLPCWNQHLVVLPGSPVDARRPLGKEHTLDASLSLVDTRQVANDYTIRFATKIYQIAREDAKAGLRGANVRVVSTLDGSHRGALSRALSFHRRMRTTVETRCSGLETPIPTKRSGPSEAYDEGTKL